MLQNSYSHKGVKRVQKYKKREKERNKTRLISTKICCVTVGSAYVTSGLYIPNSTINVIFKVKTGFLPVDYYSTDKVSKSHTHISF